MFWTEDQAFRSWLPHLQAHRGVWKKSGLQQNSLASLQEAFRLGYAMAEFDIRLTKDQKIILFHDNEINGIKINELSLAELNAIHPVNNFEEILDWLQNKTNGKFKLNIELKSSDIFTSHLEKLVSAALRKYKVDSYVMVSSFNPLALARFRMYSPQIYRALIQTLEDGDPLNTWIIRKRILNILCRPHALHLRDADWNDNDFRQVAKKVPVVLWTVNDVNVYFKLKQKIAGVISDEITPEQMAR